MDPQTISLTHNQQGIQLTNAKTRWGLFGRSERGIRAIGPLIGQRYEIADGMKRRILHITVTALRSEGFLSERCFPGKEGREIT